LCALALAPSFRFLTPPMMCLAKWYALWENYLKKQIAVEASSLTAILRYLNHIAICSGLAAIFNKSCQLHVLHVRRSSYLFTVNGSSAICRLRRRCKFSTFSLLPRFYVFEIFLIFSTCYRGFLFPVAKPKI